MQQSLITSCNDALILEHFNDYGHSYCFHTCGFLEALLLGNGSSGASGFQPILGQILGGGQPFGDSAEAYCHPQGYCVCQAACPLSVSTKNLSIYIYRVNVICN